LYLTANCGFWLATLGGPGDAALQAANFLQNHLGDNGRLPSSLHTHWLAAGLWYGLNRRGPAEHVLGFLGRRLDDLSAGNLAWLILTLLGAGVPVGHALVASAASRLEREQALDGRWPSEDGPERDVHATLEALRALRLCGRF